MALRSIVRRDTGEGYEEFLTRLAQASGIATPTREDVARLDRQRKHKGSNDDWQHPYDPDTKITKMKDGRTHLAHKAEHAVDLETGAVVAVTVQDANEGDTTTSRETLIDAAEKIEMVVSDGDGLEEVVGDKGYHSNQALVDLEAVGLRSYISEPDRGRRHWKKHPEARDPVYRNRRRIRAERGKRLLRQRGERLERPFAHLYETGRMRRVHLRGHGNILKRVLLHACALNLGLLMRTLCGVGTPRSLQGCATMLLDTLRALIRLPEVLWPVIATLCLPSTCLGHRLAHRDDRRLHVSVRTVFTTGWIHPPRGHTRRRARSTRRIQRSSGVGQPAARHRRIRRRRPGVGVVAGGDAQRVRCVRDDSRTAEWHRTCPRDRRDGPGHPTTW